MSAVSEDSVFLGNPMQSDTHNDKNQNNTFIDDEHKHESPLKQQDPHHITTLSADLDAEDGRVTKYQYK